MRPPSPHLPLEIRFQCVVKERKNFADEVKVLRRTVSALEAQLSAQRAAFNSVRISPEHLRGIHRKNLVLVPALMHLLAWWEWVTVSQLAQLLGVTRQRARSILGTFEEAEVLVQMPPLSDGSKRWAARNDTSPRTGATLERQEVAP